MDSAERTRCVKEAELLKVRVLPGCISWLLTLLSLLKSVHHPNIIQCMDIFMENNELYMVLELANG